MPVWIKDIEANPVSPIRMIFCCAVVHSESPFLLADLSLAQPMNPFGLLMRVAALCVSRVVLCMHPCAPLNINPTRLSAPFRVALPDIIQTDQFPCAPMHGAESDYIKTGN